ncbi:MAG: hypothetical protein ACSHW1_17920 [Yoonia sp.]|uniref:hypothetical protein n=1 Tax=Yoonia sp. TaxID=2212373 RepID=UPI003EF1870F
MENIILEFAASFASLMIGIAVHQFTGRTNIEIEQGHVAAIKDAVGNIVADALEDGKTDLTEIVQLATPYLLKSLPDAMAAVTPSQAAIKAIAARRLAELID